LKGLEKKKPRISRLLQDMSATPKIDDGHGFLSNKKGRTASRPFPSGVVAHAIIYINIPLAIICWASTLLLTHGDAPIPHILSPFALPTVAFATTYFMISLFVLPALAVWYDA
jgi:hypothetical protein